VLFVFAYIISSINALVKGEACRIYLFAIKIMFYANLISNRIHNGGKYIFNLSLIHKVFIIMLDKYIAWLYNINKQHKQQSHVLFGREIT